MCERCGEAKRPHRICTDNVEICAMRDEDWQVYKKSMGN
jgi:ribosomal protein L32